MKRKFITLLLIGGCFLGLRRCVRGPEKYWNEFQDMKEGEVLNILGPPIYESDPEDHQVPEGTKYLGWGYGMGWRLHVTVENGIVTEVTRSSR